jgi:tRNA(fMet)-specific endonuclease VapC
LYSHAVPSFCPRIRARQFCHSIGNLAASDSDAADYCAEIRDQLVRSGQPIGELDMMIAAHSLAAGAALVTNNIRHYARIAQPLTIENWSS